MFDNATPRPWTNDAPGCVGKFWDRGGRQTIFASLRNTAEDRDNAALAVAAVNAHDALVAACRELLSHVEAEHGLVGEAIGPEDADDGPTGAVYRARAALDISGENAQ